MLSWHWAQSPTLKVLEMRCLAASEPGHQSGHRVFAAGAVAVLAADVGDDLQVMGHRRPIAVGQHRREGPAHLAWQHRQTRR